MRTKQQFLSMVLLAILSISIIPIESFHSHEEAHVICKDAAKHIEAKEFECDLCDFVLPLFESSNSATELNIAVIYTLKLECLQVPISRELFDIPQYRGPPIA